jgi:hypothetical protein
MVEILDSRVKQIQKYNDRRLDDILTEVRLIRGEVGDIRSDMLDKSDVETIVGAAVAVHAAQEAREQAQEAKRTFLGQSGTDWAKIGGGITVLVTAIAAMLQGGCW